MHLAIVLKNHSKYAYIHIIRLFDPVLKVKRYFQNHDAPYIGEYTYLVTILLIPIYTYLWCIYSFCLGDMQVQVDDVTLKQDDVAIICVSHLTKYKEGSAQIDFIPLLLIDNIFNVLSLTFNITSTLLLLLTAATYYMLPNLRSVQDTCYFYLCSTVGLGHLAYSYMAIFGEEGILPNLCFARSK